MVELPLPPGLVSGQVFSMTASGTTVARDARTWRGRKRLLLLPKSPSFVPPPALSGEGSLTLCGCLWVLGWWFQLVDVRVCGRYAAMILTTTAATPRAGAGRTTGRRPGGRGR